MISRKTTYRFFDGAREPCVMLTPIEGFDKKPLVTLEQAVEPLISMIPDIQIKVDKAKNRALHNTDDLPLDESAAIVLYTMEWHPHTNSLYYILNENLRAEDREHLKPWFLYLKLIFTALSRLPTINLTIYRGVRLIDYLKYQPENSFVWWGFSSCSMNKNIAENKHFLGQDGERILFIIDSIKGIDISKHSYFRKEKEVLLLPATTLQVIQCNYQTDDLYVIHLKEIESPYQLLESVSIELKIQTIKTSSELNNISSSSKPNVNVKLNEEIARFKDRSHACLFRKHFTDNDIEIIVQQVINIKHCRVLTLRGEQITSKGALILGKSLDNNHTLEELYITDIQIGDIGAQALAESLSNRMNLSLKRLCLNHNGITDIGAESIAKMLKTNQLLTHLWLPKNHISDRGIKSLVDALIDNKTLQEFSLEWNTFENDETVDSLVQIIEKNQTLIEIHIDGRDLSRNDIKKLKQTAKTKKGFKLKIH
jgi:hypothetical protein